MTIRFPVGHFLLVIVWNQTYISLTVYEIFNRKCDAVIRYDMMLYDRRV